jgi:hypothetical protein
MAISLQDIDIIFENRKNFSGGKIIFVGEHFCNFNKIENFYLQKWGTFNICKKFKKVTDKIFLNELFQFFGYEQLFITDYAKLETVDFAADLTKENCYSKINEKFDIIVDNGTSLYTTNLDQAYKNIISLCNDSSIIITKFDPMTFNRFPIQSSPEFIIDYFVSEGFDVNQANLINGNGKFLSNYKIIYDLKHYHIFEALNFWNFIKYIFYVVLLYSRKSNFKYSFVAKDYRKYKTNNFNDLKLFLKKKPQTLRNFVQKNFSKVSYEKIKRFYHLLTSFFYFGSGRILISLVFTNNVNNKKLNKFSTSVHYHVKYDKINNS